LLGFGQWKLDRVEHAWSGPRGERERRIERASSHLDRDLTYARLLADSLARRGLGLGMLLREPGFDAAAQLTKGQRLESAVMLFNNSGSPSVWAGRFRLAPRPAGDSVQVRLTPYYAVLEVRRHDGSGRTAVGSVLLGSDPVIPDGGESVAARFREQTEVGLRLLPPEAAPDISDVFDYQLPTTAGPRVLFSVQFVPPEQHEAIGRARQTATSRVAWLLLLTIAAAMWVVPAGLGRLVVLLLPLVPVFRSPLGSSLGIQEWFDPEIFRTGFLGPVTSSAAAVALTGIALIVMARILVPRIPRRIGMPLGMVLLAVTPFGLARLSTGVSLPIAGVSTRIFLIWELTLFIAAAGILAFAVAMLRREQVARFGRAGVVVTLLVCLGLAVLGFLLWRPEGWPSWYFALWVIPALPMLLPHSAMQESVTVAVIAGSLAAVLVWSADNLWKVRAAQADIAELLDRNPPDLTDELHRVGTALLGSPAPENAVDLYRLWRQSTLHTQRHPVILGLWTTSGERLAELRLDELDLSIGRLAGAIRDQSRGDSISVATLDQDPVPIHLLLVRKDSLHVVSVAIGPSTGLVAPSRIGRLLGVSVGRSSYRLNFAPAPSRPAETGSKVWRREGPRVFGHARIEDGGVARGLFGTIEIGAPDSLAVRGALLLLLDGLLFAALWTLAGVLSGELPRRPTWIPRLRSYQARVGVALAVFFLTPTIGFAAWGIGRLRGEVQASRDRGIEQTLRDVLSGRATLSSDSAAVAEQLQELTNRIDADFVLYREGQKVAGTSGGVLESLGLIAPVLDPETFHRLVIDGAEVTTRPSPSRALDVRVGYRSLRLSDPAGGVLAMPQTGFDPVLQEGQRDLAFLFLLLTVLGIGASLLAAHFAARALARPVAELRSAALAFGKGGEVTLPSEPPAPEFSPVYAAFEKMTADVRKTQEAQERVARIVAWGEMASQVAHEIKNPLTPMRLGVQHLRRVHEDGHTPIGPVLETTTTRILAEIDRLDRIARSFSRFGVPSSQHGPLEVVKLPSVVRDVAELYRLGPEGAEIVVETEAAEPAAARADEVKEALVNLLENSRAARARLIRIRIRGTTIGVEDDGRGIPADLLPRIFEPRFSTSTSGSGLGLAIVKRLVEGWGGTVAVRSTEGRGTVVELHLRPAGQGGPGSASSEGEAPKERVQ
jgi:signal transduction histidine kinase